MPDDKKAAKPAPDSADTDKTPPPVPARAKRAAEPPAAARVCHENERATAGLTRYRVRAIDRDRPLGLYLLAPDRAAAETCYLKHEQFGDQDRSTLHVEELPD